MGKWTVEQVADGLRDLAMYMENHADLPYNLSQHCPAIRVENYLYGDKDEPKLTDVARKMGKCDKRAEYGMYILSRTFGGGSVEVTFEQSRESVCTKVQTGTRIVTIPAREAEVREEPEYEYSCPESLLRNT